MLSSGADQDEEESSLSVTSQTLEATDSFEVTEMSENISVRSDDSELAYLVTENSSSAEFLGDSRSNFNENGEAKSSGARSVSRATSPIREFCSSYRHRGILTRQIPLKEDSFMTSEDSDSQLNIDRDKEGRKAPKVYQASFRRKAPRIHKSDNENIDKEAKQIKEK